MKPQNHTYSHVANELSKFKNRKLWKLLALLTSKEKKQFSCWLQGELHSQTHKVVLLYQMVTSRKEVEEIWQKLFPEIMCKGSPFNDSRFRKLESQLIHYIEDFLAMEAFRNRPYSRDIYLIRELNQRNANTLFDIEMRKVRRKLDKDFMLEKERFMMLYQLELEQQKHLNKSHSKRKRKPASSLGEAFDLWWLHEKLWLANHDLNVQKIKGEQISTLFVPEILDLVEKNEKYHQYPLLRIYQKLYLLRQDRGNPKEVITLIQKYSDQLGEEELRDIFSLISNYFIQKINETGDVSYLEILLSLIELGVQDQIIFDNGYLPWRWYKNIITICIRLNKLNQAREYLNELKKSLKKEDREEAYRFNLAHCYFAEGSFAKVIKILSQRYSNLTYEMHSRLILCKAFYELNEIDELETRLRSLRVFISRQKTISEMVKKTYINQIKLFEALIKAYTLEDFVKLAQNVHSVYPLSAREWLIEKINENLAKFNADPIAL